MRLYFFDTTLPKSADGTKAAFIRMTSGLDGYEQELDADGLARWRNSSAYFNGNSVTVALWTYPGLDPARVQIDIALIGSMLEGGAAQQPPASICFSDDRAQSTDPRAGRIVNPAPGVLIDGACSGWLIDDAAHCMLTAGHCCNIFDFVGNCPVVQFQVPDSYPNGTFGHPPPEHQYAVDQLSEQFGGISARNDWCYFGAFPNERCPSVDPMGVFLRNTFL